MMDLGGLHEHSGHTERIDALCDAPLHERAGTPGARPAALVYARD